MNKHSSRIRVTCMAVIAAAGSTSCADQTGAIPPTPSIVDVSMREYTFGSQPVVPAGRVVFRVRNTGAVEHQLRLLRIPRGMPPLGEQFADESLPRRVVDTLTILPALGPGSSTVFAADLRPARYAFICFLHDASGLPHAYRGMHQEFESGGSADLPPDTGRRRRDG